MAFCKNRDPRDMLAELIEAGICKKSLPIHDLGDCPLIYDGRRYPATCVTTE